MPSDARQGIKLCPRVTCPHCWHNFAPEQALWIAEHPDLLGDSRLGADQPQRFLPTRFSVEGAALDRAASLAMGWRVPTAI